jgi:hypothetical protein
LEKNGEGKEGRRKRGRVFLDATPFSFFAALFDPHELFSDLYVAEKNRYDESEGMLAF